MSELFEREGVVGDLHRPGGDPVAALLLAHGAGGDRNAKLLQRAASEFAGAGLLVLRYDLPFRQRRPKGPPSPSTAGKDRDGIAAAAQHLRAGERRQRLARAHHPAAAEDHRPAASEPRVTAPRGEHGRRGSKDRGDQGIEGSRDRGIEGSRTMRTIRLDPLIPRSPDPCLRHLSALISFPAVLIVGFGSRAVEPTANPMLALFGDPSRTRKPREAGITHVLDLRESHEWSSPWIGQDAIDEMAARGIVRFHLPIEDCCAPSLETLDSAIDFIDSALAEPKARVYVHCRAGIERTGCVLVAWYGRTHGVDFTSALAAVRRKRDALSPGREQADVARAWLHAREPS